MRDINGTMEYEFKNYVNSEYGKLTLVGIKLDIKRINAVLKKSNAPFDSIFQIKNCTELDDTLVLLASNRVNSKLVRMYRTFLKKKGLDQISANQDAIHANPIQQTTKMVAATSEDNNSSDISKERSELSKPNYSFEINGECFWGETASKALVDFCNKLIKKDLERFGTIIDKQYNGKGSVVVTSYADDESYIKLDNCEGYISSTWSLEACSIYAKWIYKEWVLKDTDIPVSSFVTTNSNINECKNRIDETSADNEQIRLFDFVEAKKEESKSFSSEISESRPLLELNEMNTDVSESIDISSNDIEEKETDIHTNIATSSNLQSQNCHVSKVLNSNDPIFLEKYDLDLSICGNLSISGAGFSIRTEKRLLRNGILSISDLSNRSESELRKIKGFGQKCVDEVNQCLASLSNVLPSSDKTIRNYAIASNEIKELYKYKDAIFSGNVNSIDKSSLSSTAINMLSNLEKAYNILGEELIELLEEEDSKEYLMYCVDSFRKQFGIFEKISSLLKSIPSNRLAMYAKSYIYLYTKNTDDRNKLLSMFKSEDSTLGEIDFNAVVNDYHTAYSFLKWCSFNVYQETKEFLIQLEAKSNRMIDIINMRANGRSLQEVGDELDLTRERVRQIESKAIDLFGKWNSNMHILNKICVDREDDEVLTPVELEEYFGDRTEFLLYLLQRQETDDYVYDKNMNVFLIGDGRVSEKCSQFLDEIPDIIPCAKLNYYIGFAEDKGIAEEYFSKAFNDSYKSSGKVFHRNRLSLSKVYSVIMKKYYSDGIHVYDDDTLNQFRMKVIHEFGEINLPENNRAISARLADIGILCGRGMYKPKCDFYISKELTNSIDRYIDNSEFGVIPINTLFTIFKQDLLSFGIDNSYYLQGILHELLGDKYIWKRDYILKNSDADSFYREIYRMIKDSDSPVDKSSLVLKFPGITEVVLNYATHQNGILNFFGKYVHISNLNIKDVHKYYYKSVVKKNLEENEIVNCRDIYSYIEKDNPTYLSSFGIYNQFSLFSVLENIFDGQFELNRPLIGKAGCKIERPEEMLLKRILSTTQISVKEIVQFMRSEYIQVPSILDYLDGLNATHIFVSKQELCRIDETGIYPGLIEIIKSLIIDEVTDTMPISSLKCIYKFPLINTKWNEWFIYSIIKKWIPELDVAAYGSQFRYSIPLVSKCGQMNVKDFNKESVQSTIGQIDDLDDIDALIDDIIIDEIEDAMNEL